MQDYCDKWVINQEQLEGLLLLIGESAKAAAEQRIANSILLHLLSLKQEQLVEFREALGMIAEWVRQKSGSNTVPEAV